MKNKLALTTNKFGSAILLTLILFLTGCGFHLRGTSALPPQLRTMYVQSTFQYSEFTRQLKKTLKFSHVRLVNSASQAPITLSITNENFSTYQTTIGSTGQSRQYNATYTITYNIQAADGTIIVGPLAVSNTTTITIGPNEILENSNKLNIAKQSLIRNLVMKMMFQLTAKNTIASLNRATTATKFKS
jgi:LPS-assembly lipoprotein